MEVMYMKTSKNILTDKELELVSMLMQDCKSTGDIQSKLKRLFAGTIEQMLEAAPPAGPHWPACGVKWRAAFLTLIGTGLRIGELLALEWGFRNYYATRI